MTTQQATIPASYVRGGTSRAVVFRREDLPQDQGKWKRIFQTVLGSPDPESKQLDGLGGGITSLSKIAILSKSARAGIDVDYLFVQIEPTTGEMLLDANCGNISSAVGPFARDEGWVIPEANGNAVVRIFNENTDKVIRSAFNDQLPVEEHIEISGVAGRHTPIKLTFEDPEGSMGPSAFPSNAKTETLELPTLGRSVDVTLIDVTLPCAMVRAADIGKTGHESYAELVADAEFIALMTEIRVASAVRMGICATARDAREVYLNVPDVVVVATPRDDVPGVVARFVSCDRPHRAAPVTSSMALAAAARIPGTIPAGVVTPSAKDTVTILHPSGTIDVDVQTREDGSIASTSILRTARRIMQGEVVLPFSI